MSNKNPIGKCVYCSNPIHFMDEYCEFCGRENAGWQEVSETQCGNCHSHIEDGDNYCRICGTKVGEGSYEPYQDLMECIYGPMPEKRKHRCGDCGYKWTTYKMLDAERFCPKCGGDTKVSLEEVVNNSNNILESEYIMIDSDITTILYSDILNLTNESTGENFSVQKQEVTVGRSSSCDIVLENMSIPRIHATFYYENNNWFLRDNHTTNGTWINGIRMQSGKKYQLLANDEINFAGENRFIFYKTDIYGSASNNLEQKDNLIGTVINDKYMVLKQIWKGFFWEVYLVIEEKKNKPWAMKICNKNSLKDAPNYYEIIRQEVYGMMKLNHPMIPQIADIIENENYICIIREYIEGNTLKDILKKEGVLTQEKVIDLGRQLCDVLSYLHNMTPPYIHQDIKPANIILRPDGGIKLIDFETMKSYYNRMHDTGFYLWGTFGYAAPEQYGGMGQRDARTDIFGLGMTIYHLITGVNPSEPPYEIKPIREINPDLSCGVEYIISKCIEPNPKDRYQTCEELLQDLNYYNNIGTKKKKGFWARIFKK